MEDIKKCIKEVLTNELVDLKLKARLMEKVYLEDTNECNEKIEEIKKRQGEVRTTYEKEYNKFTRKVLYFALVIALISGVMVLITSIIIPNAVLSLHATLIFEMLFSILYLCKQYKKMENINFSYVKELEILTKNIEDYERIKEDVKIEYTTLCNLVTEKEKEIANVDNISVTYEMVDDIEKTSTCDKPYTRKLERK